MLLEPYIIPKDKPMVSNAKSNTILPKVTEEQKLGKYLLIDIAKAPLKANDAKVLFLKSV